MEISASQFYVQNKNEKLSLWESFQRSSVILNLKIAGN